MDRNPFSNGDVVRLKTGGPKMTVEVAEDDRVCTVWFERQSEMADLWEGPFRAEFYRSHLIETE